MSTRTIATKLALDGETEYKAKLKNINAELALHKSELEKTQAQYKNSANGMEALSAKQSALKGQIEALNQKHQEQAAMLDKAREAQQKYAQKAEELKGRLAELADSSEDTAEEEKKLRDELASTEESMQKAANSATFYQKQLNNTERDQAKLGAELERTEQYLDEARASADGCARSIDQYGKEVKQAGDSSEQFGSTSKGAVEQLASALAAAGIAASVKEIADALMDCVDTFADFQAQMSTVQAISGASGDQMEALAEKAKYMGATTSFTATEAGQALEYMAMAGWKTGDMLDGLESIMHLAAASGENLAATSDIVTDALTAFGLTAADGARFADVLAAASSNANTNVSMMGETFKYAAPVAGALGYSIEDTALAIGLMANAGIKGSQAGSALRGALTNLAKPSEQVAEYMEALGVSLTDSAGRTRSLSELMAVLRDRFAGLTEAQQAEYAAGIAGKEAMSGLLAIVNASEADYRKLAEAIDASSGAAKEMSEIRLDNYAGQMTLLASAADGLKLAVGEQLTPALTNLAEAGTDALTWATDFVSENEWVVGAVVGLTAAFAALTAGVIIYEKRTELATAKTAMLNAVMNTNPAVFVASALIGLVTAIGIYAASVDNADEDTRKFIQSLKDSKEAYEELQASMGEQQDSAMATADALKELLAVEGKSAAQKDVILDMVEKLNEAVPGLALAYDAEADAINMTAGALDAMLEKTAAQEEYQGQVERLSQLRTEGAEIAARLKEAEEQLAASQQQVQEQMAGCFDIAVDYNAALEQGGAANQELANTVRELTIAQEENATQIAALEEASSAYAEQQAEDTLAVETMTARVDELTAQMQSLEEEYQKSYDAARESIESQLGLFNELDGSAKTSITNLIDTLKGQVEYMDTYAANIQKAMELGVDQGLIQKLSDGSEESAQILAAIVQGGEEDIAALNEQLAKVEEGKENFSSTVAEMETDFDNKMKEVVLDLEQAIQDMDLHDAAYTVGFNNIQGLLNGSIARRNELVDAYAQMGKDALAAYKKAVGQASPSKKFTEAGRFDIQGLINGVEEKTPEAKAAYEKVAEAAKTVMSGLNDWIADMEHDMFLRQKNGADTMENTVASYRAMQEAVHQTAEWYRAQGYAETSDEIQKLQKLWWGYADSIVTQQSNAAKAVIDGIKSQFDGLADLMNVKADVGDLEYQLWERTEGKGATELEKYTKQQELLSAKLEDQRSVVAAAEAAYEAVVEQYGAASGESYAYQKALLQEKLALQDLLDEIEKVTAAKQEMARQEFTQQAQARWEASALGIAAAEAMEAGNADPYGIARKAGLNVVSPNGELLEAASQTVMESMARHLPTIREVPRTQDIIGRQMEAMTAATVNAISGIAQGGGAVREVVRLVTVDGKVLASACFNDLVDYGDSNGTPILNPSR